MPLTRDELNRLSELTNLADPEGAIDDAYKACRDNLSDREWREFQALADKKDDAVNSRSSNDLALDQSRSFGGGNTPEDQAFTSYLRNGVIGPELRAQGGDTGGSNGGYLVPQGFWNRLAVAMKMYGGASGYFAQNATDDGRVQPYPTNDPVNVVGAYITENTQISDTTYTFGQGMQYAWTITSGVIKASLQLVQDSAVNVDDFVAARVGESIGRKIAAEVINGSGAGSKALAGLIPSLSAFGSSNSSGGYFQLGAATSVKTFNAPTGATELVGNVLSPATVFQMIAAVDPAYWDNAAFYMNAKQALNERQVVDSNGRPLLNLDNGFADGAIGSIAGFPVRIVNEIPNLAASTVGGPVFGDLGHAMVLRTVRNTNSVMRLTERYADFLQVGFIGYVRADSQPVDLRAAVTIQGNTT